MIIKMDKKFEDCSVGILGFRGNLLVDSLKKNNIRNYKLLEDESDISNNLDFVFVSGYYKIISDKVIDRVRYGIYCFHESPLPEGRGHAPGRVSHGAGERMGKRARGATQRGGGQMVS